MRCDQQHGEKAPTMHVSAWLRMALQHIVICGPDKVVEDALNQAADAVAEYIAANDEYDAAWHAMRYDQSSECGIRFNAARDRRTLAHARMKGETK